MRYSLAWGLEPPWEAERYPRHEQLGLRPQWLKVKGPIPDLEGAFTAMRNERAEALLVLDVPIPIIHQKRIARAGGHVSPSDDVSGRPADVGSGGLDRLRDRPSRYVTANTRVCGKDFRGRQTGQLTGSRSLTQHISDIQSQDGSDNWCRQFRQSCSNGRIQVIE